MAWWVYLGKVTTPIDVPGKGPMVLVPRLKFEAPMASVSHLTRLKMVAPLKLHQIPKQLDPAIKKVDAKEVSVPSAPVPIEALKKEEKKEEFSHDNTSVVASEDNSLEVKLEKE